MEHKADPACYRDDIELKGEETDSPTVTEPLPLQNGNLSLQRAGFTPYEPSYLAKPQQSVMQTTLVQQPDESHMKYLAASGDFIYSDFPVSMRCPFCHRDIITSLMYQPGSATWLAVGALVALCCWAGCCVVPLYIDGLKDTVHTCPNCRRKVGISRRLK